MAVRYDNVKTQGSRIAKGTIWWKRIRILSIISKKPLNLLSLFGHVSSPGERE